MGKAEAVLNTNKGLQISMHSIFKPLSSHVARTMAISDLYGRGVLATQTPVLGSISMPGNSILGLHLYHGMDVASGKLGCVS
jgi:hypothetical protein